MPSPIAHLSVGYLLYRFFERRAVPFRREASHWQSVAGLAAFLFLSMAPDLDAVVGILTGQLGRYHNQWTHSLASCAVASLGGALLLRSQRRWRLAHCIGAAFACYGLHILMDTLSYGRGVMLLWPLSEARFLSPVLIFVGLHWSHGLWSPAHLLTALNEALFIAILLAIIALCRKLRRRTTEPTR
jgi:inner membrane protein